jgi:hypothetical protein
MKVAVRLLWALTILAVPVLAASGELEVQAMTFCTSVEDRAPVGESAAFDSDVGRVYCFTKIVGADTTTSVFHVWYHGDEEMARVELAVNSGSWRTWSSKNILPSWTGTWRVEVQSGDGTVLHSADFTVRPPEPAKGPEPEPEPESD